jgi:hypothetical protein
MYGAQEPVPASIVDPVHMLRSPAPVLRERTGDLGSGIEIVGQVPAMKMHYFQSRCSRGPELEQTLPTIHLLAGTNATQMYMPF